MKKHFLIFLAIAVVLLSLAGCGSRKGAVLQSHRELPSIPAGTANAIIREAEKWIGTPYRYGAQTRRKGTDCSGMTMVIFRDKAGVALPRNSAEQQRFCMPVSRDDLQPGDLVFFSSSTRGGRVNHVGIYRGNGDFIHASSSRGVMVSNLSQKYFANHFHSAGRVRELASAKPQRRKNDRVSPPEPLQEPEQALVAVAESVRPPQNYVEIIFGVDSFPQALVARDSLPSDTAENHFEQAWQRAEAELDSIITASIDSLANIAPGEQ